MVALQDLSVATVAAIIAAAVFIIQFVVPILIPLVLVGSLTEENSAVTWSVVGRTLHSSTWPVLLHSDTASIVGVQRRVNVISWYQTILLVVVAVAAVVTPLGLYESVSQEQKLTELSFQYVQDPSPIGYGTPARSELGFSRVCGNVILVNCPWTDNNLTSVRNSTGLYSSIPNGYDPRLPQNLTDLFSSGLDNFNSSVSSVFDIQWRTYETVVDDIINNGSDYLVGAYRTLDTLILRDTIEPVEGLIVNTKTGGIGFRNHSVPPPLKYGGNWAEDLLWMEPETQCVDLNMTLDFTIRDPRDIYYSSGNLLNLFLTDRGGFASFDKQLPTYDFNDTQTNPNLYDRAYFAAVYNNIYSMLYLNVTNPGPGRFRYLDSTIDKQFSLGNGSKGAVSYDLVTTDLQYGNVLGVPSNTSSVSNYTDTDFPNPFNISSSNFSDIGQSCAFDRGGSQRANISSILVACGLIYGAARPMDGSSSLIFTKGTKWQIPMYSCASGVKASVKSVSFQYTGNGTADFRELKVTDFKDKEYTEEARKPLWGVERSSEYISDVAPVWGLISERYQNTPNISTLRKDHLWLPGALGYFESGVGTGYQNLPGVDFFRQALTSAYSLNSVTNDGVTTDYTGKTNLAMYSKWQEFSRHANTTANIINLVWTDIAANAVTGTRGWMGYEGYKTLAQRDTVPNKSGSLVPITLNTRSVKYHLPYAIPGIIALALLLTTVICALAMVCLGRTKNDKIRQFLNATSAGRLMTTFLYTHDAHPAARKKEWLVHAGRKRVNVGGPFPLARDATHNAASPFSPSAAHVPSDEKIHAHHVTPSPSSSLMQAPPPQQQQQQQQQHPPSHFMHANQGYAYVPPAPPPVPVLHDGGYQDYSYVPLPAPYGTQQHGYGVLASVPDSRSGGEARYERVRTTEGES